MASRARPGRAGKKKAKRGRGGKSSRSVQGLGDVVSALSWPVARRFLLRATLVYLGFNLVLNLLLALTRPIDLSSLFVLGHLDSRSQAAWLLSKHTLWHSSWEDEQNIPALIEEYAREHRVDPALLQALVEQESAGRPHVISGVGACGLTQLMPATARELGVTDPFDPRQSLSGGARYLAQLKRRFSGSIPLALAAYNAGPGAVARAGGIPPYRETRDYVYKISRRYALLTGRRVPSVPSVPSVSKPVRPRSPASTEVAAQETSRSKPAGIKGDTVKAVVAPTSSAPPGAQKPSTGQAGGTSGGKADGKAGTKAGGKADTKAGAKPETKPGAGPETKPETGPSAASAVTESESRSKSNSSGLETEGNP